MAAVRIQITKGKPRKDAVEPDLRTPGGRVLPF